MTSQILTQEFVLTALMLAGAGLGKFRIITREALHGLSAVLVSVTLPCTIMDSFRFEVSRAVLANAATVFVISIIAHVGVIAISRLCYRTISTPRRNVLTFATVFSNCGFIGIPLAQGLFGGIGVFYVSIFSIPFNILMFTYGVRLLCGGGGNIAIRDFFSPPLIGTLLGLVLFLTSTHLPGLLAQTIGTIGAMTTPLSMLIIGIILAETNITGLLGRWEMYLLGCLKLVVLPLVLLGVLRLLPVDHIIVCICVMAVAMPTASMAGVLAKRYGGDAYAAAQSILFTTVLSAVTLPAILIFCFRPGLP